MPNVVIVRNTYPNNAALNNVIHYALNKAITMFTVDTVDYMVINDYKCTNTSLMGSCSTITIPVNVFSLEVYWHEKQR